MDKNIRCRDDSPINNESSLFKLYFEALKKVIVLPIAIPVAAVILTFFGWVMNTASKISDEVQSNKEQD